jgi:hypothetical protein
MQLKDDEVAFPTTDSSGFRDRDDLRSLQMDAVTLAQTERSEAEKKQYGGKQCTEDEVKDDVGGTCELVCKKDGRLGTTKCSVLAEEDPQTVSSRRYILWLLFKREGGKNLFEPAVLTKINAIVQRVLTDASFSNFCLKIKESSQLEFIKNNPSAGGGMMSALLADTESKYTCAMPTSPLSWAFPSTVTATYDTSAMTLPAEIPPTMFTYPDDKMYIPDAKLLEGLGPLLTTSGATKMATETLRFDGMGATTVPCAIGTVSSRPCFNLTCPTGCFGTHCDCTPGETKSEQQRVDAALSVMANQPWTLSMVGKSFSAEAPQSDVMRLQVSFGGPLCTPDGKCYKNNDDDPTAQTKMFTDWAGADLKTFLDEADFDDVEVLYFWPVISFKEFLSILLHDGLLAIGSIVFVFFYLWIHSGSAFLAMAGMLHVMMSFPLAFLLYRYLFGIMPFYILSFLSIYIILAIGADDIFVYMDAWRQSAFEGPEVNLNLHTRMAYTFKRAAKAVSC